MAKRILVVDDDLFIRELYEEVLKNSGYDVDAAAGGKEGLSKLQTGGYDLTLLDMHLPEFDGLDILNSLSQNPPLSKNGPIILLTNMDMDEKVKEGLGKGAQSYLIKAQLTPEQLISEIKKILSASVS